MQLIQPKAKQLQEKYRNADPARLNQELQALYPNAAWRFAHMLDRAQVEAAVQEHGCEVIVFAMRLFNEDEELDRWRCENNLVASGPPVFTKPVAIAASREIVQGMSYLNSLDPNADPSETDEDWQHGHSGAVAPRVARVVQLLRT